MRHNLITDDKIKPFLETQTFGRNIYALWSVKSTMDFANNLANQNEREGTLVIAEQQTSGRGRMNRRWDSQFGKGLWFSLILRPDDVTKHAGLYPFLASLSVAQAVEKKCGFKPDLKWPNDLLFHEKKFCGILSEAEFSNNHIKHIILGIGINVNHRFIEIPNNLNQHATSLRIAAHSRIDRIELLIEILHCLEENYNHANEHGFNQIIEQWKNHCPQIGKKVHIAQDNNHYHGMFVDLDEMGGVLLKLSDGTIQNIYTGEFV